MYPNFTSIVTICSIHSMLPIYWPEQIIYANLDTDFFSESTLPTDLQHVDKKITFPFDMNNHTGPIVLHLS